MPFLSGDPQAPVVVRLARNLLLVQAGLAFLPIILVIVVSATIGSSVTSSEHSSVTQSGQSLAYVVLGAGFVALLGVAYGVSRVQPWARWGAIIVEAVWTVAIVVPTARDNPLGNFLYFLIAAAVTVLLLMPESVAAFNAAAAKRVVRTGGADPESVVPLYEAASAESAHTGPFGESDLVEATTPATHEADAAGPVDPPPAAAGEPAPDGIASSASGAPAPPVSGKARRPRRKRTPPSDPAQV